MKKTITLILIGLTILSGGLLLRNSALAACGDGGAINDIKCGAETTDNGSCSETVTTDCTPTVDNAITTAVTIFTIIVGVMSVIMIIMGGFKYITSAGDANKVAAAKNTVVYALIGVVLVALAQVIIRFVVSKSTSITNPPAVTAPSCTPTAGHPCPAG